MADTKITALTALTAADPANDVIPIVDVSDTTMAASGTTKKISVNNILSSSPTASGALTVTGLVTAGSATITGNLTVDTNTLVVTASTDTVCIGATTTDAKFRILDASGNGVRIGFLPGTLNYNLYDATVHEFRATSGSNSFGAITANGIGLGVTPSTSGIGVTFKAAQSASSDANCLDDYEEGTFTATLNGSVANPTITQTATGRYTKVGRQVTVQVFFSSATTTGASGRIQIIGLPFANNASVEAISNVAFYSMATFTGIPVGITLASGTSIDMYSSQSGAVYQPVNFNTGAAQSVWVSLTYTV